MEWFSAWWDGLLLVEQILYCIAVPASVILIIQTILIFCGFGDSGSGDGVNISDTSGIDGDFSGDAGADMVDIANSDAGAPTDIATFNFFTLQGVVAFFCVFGWVSLACIGSGVGMVVSLIIGFILGVGAMFGVAKIIQLSSRLAQNGNININNYIGKPASVYVTVPSAGNGQGKVNISVDERYIECDAVTDGDELPTGTSVKVKDTRGQLLVVEKE